MSTSNFDFLKTEYPELARLAYLAECYYDSDPTSSLAKMRTFCEFIVKDIYIQKASLTPDLKLADLIKYCRQNELMPDKIANIIDLVRIKGNYAVHEQKGTAKEALESLNNIYFVAYWYYMLKTDTKPEFKPFEIPVNQDKKVIDEQKKLIETLQKQLDEQLKFRIQIKKKFFNLKNVLQPFLNIKNLQLQKNKQDKNLLILNCKNRVGKLSILRKTWNSTHLTILRLENCLLMKALRIMLYLLRVIC